jgi:hypothetical protein
LNRGDTAYDGAADLRFQNDIIDALPPIVEKVKDLLKKD